MPEKPRGKSAVQRGFRAIAQRGALWDGRRKRGAPVQPPEGSRPCERLKKRAEGAAGRRAGARRTEGDGSGPEAAASAATTTLTPRPCGPHSASAPAPALAVLRPPPSALRPACPRDRRPGDVTAASSAASAPPPGTGGPGLPAQLPCGSQGLQAWPGRPSLFWANVASPPPGCRPPPPAATTLPATDLRPLWRAHAQWNGNRSR